MGVDVNGTEAVFLGALFTGALIGAVITLDPWLTAMVDLDVPLVVTGGIFIALALITVFIRVQPWLYARRDSVVLFLLFLGFHTTAIQAGLDVGELSIVLILPLTLLDALSKNGRKFPITPFFFLALLFLAIILTSLAKDFNPFAIRREVKAILIYLLIFTYLHWRASPEWMVRVLIGFTTVSCMLAIFQEGYYLATGNLFVGILERRFLREMFVETPFGPLFRTPGFTVSYRTLSSLLALSLALLASRMMDAEARKNLTNRWLLALHVCAIFLTFAKDVMLGLLIGTGVALVFMRPRRLLWLTGWSALGLALLLLTIAYMPGGPLTFADLVHDFTSSERVRVQLNREGIEGFLRSGDYLLGAGIAGPLSFTDHYRGWPAHNAFILVVDAAGLIGLASLLSLYGWVGYRLWQIRFLVHSDSDIILARGLGVFFFTQLVGAQFTATFTEHIFWLYAALVEVTAVRLLRPGYDSKPGS